jgi:hypothetical protein
MVAQAAGRVCIEYKMALQAAGRDCIEYKMVAQAARRVCIGYKVVPQPAGRVCIGYKVVAQAAGREPTLFGYTGHSILSNLIRTLFSKQNNLSSIMSITHAPQPYLPYSPSVFG